MKAAARKRKEALRKLHHGRCSECGPLMVPEQESMVQFSTAGVRWRLPQQAPGTTSVARELDKVVEAS